MDDNQNYVQLAERAWNEAAPIHWQVTQSLLEEMKDPNRLYLHNIQIDELKRLSLNVSTVAHLNCNNGRETISIKRLGAPRVVGFDIAQAFISQAKHLAEAANVDCEFVCSDAYEIPQDFNSQFDIVVITAGALTFMPDLTRYFQVAHRLLKKGGWLTIYEAHPITRMYLMDRDRKDRPIEIVKSYFASGPTLHETGLDYQGGTTYKASPIYYFPHKMSDVISAVIEAGFSLVRFIEHDQDPSQARKSFESLPAKPPLSYILTAKAY